MGNRVHRVYTVGHSQHDVATLIQLLAAAGVTEVIDVRSAPYSQRYPQFNQFELQGNLKREGINYVFLGDALGGRPPHDQVYDESGRVDYQRVRGESFFQRGLEALRQRAAAATVALLCAEEDPLDCHRGLLIAPALKEGQIDVAHIRGDGSVETMQQMEERLLAQTSVGADLFQGLFAKCLTDDERRQLLGDAYQERARKAAFRARNVRAQPADQDSFSQPWEEEP